MCQEPASGIGHGHGKWVGGSRFRTNPLKGKIENLSISAIPFLPPEPTLINCSILETSWMAEQGWIGSGGGGMHQGLHRASGLPTPWERNSRALYSFEIAYCRLLQHGRRFLSLRLFKRSPTMYAPFPWTYTGNILKKCFACFWIWDFILVFDFLFVLGA